MRYIAAILLSLGITPAWAQGNFVLNSSFDQFTTCQNTLSQVYCDDWRAYTGSSTDYFNSCATAATGDSTPLNFFGYQVPLHGNGYVGLYTFNNGPVSTSYKEYIAGKVVPLAAGGRYKASIWVSMADSAGLATDDLGVFFFKDGPVYGLSAGVSAIPPQVSYSGYGPVTDKINWVQLTGTFRADSAFDDIVVGGFGNYATMGKQVVDTAKAYLGYYYLDSVEVVFDDTLGIVCNDTMACAADTLHVYYAMQQGYFNPSNVLTVQLSGPTGSFSNPQTIATATGNTSGMIKAVVPNGIPFGLGYRVRVAASSPNIISNISTKNLILGDTTPAKPVATVNSPLCSGKPANFSATSSSPVMGWSWKGPLNFSSQQQNPTIAVSSVPMSGEYIVTAHNYGCFSRDTISLAVKQSPYSTTGLSNAPICETDTLKLSTGNNILGTSFSWTGPNGFTSQQQKPKLFPVSVVNNGAYIITCELNGCQTKDTVDVVIYTMPQGLATHADSAVCAGDTLHLHAYSTTQGVSYAWVGPNSFISMQQNPVLPNAVNLNGGSYIAAYTNGACVKKDTVVVIVKPLPSPTVASNSGPVCEGTLLNLVVTTGFAGSSYSWSGPGNFSSSLQNPVVSNTTLLMTGDYVVTATLNGCNKKDTTLVTIKPVPAVTATNNGPVCTGQSIGFNATANLPGVSYSWTGPASFTSTQQDPVRSNSSTNMSGTYMVTATLNGCTSAAVSTSAIIKPLPAVPTANSNTPVCAGGILNLGANSTTSGVSYTWTGPGSFTSNLQNPSVSPVGLSDAGIYHVIAELNGCLSTGNGSATVVVNSVSSLGIYPSPNDTLCINSNNATFVAVPFNAGSNPQYQWYKNNNTMTGATSISYPATAIADQDSFYCRMTATGICADPLILYSNKIGMTILPMTPGPKVSITADPGILLSPWQLVKFTAIATSAGSNPQYQWKRNGQNVVGAVNDNWSAYNLNSGDNISCVVTSSQWCADPASAESNKMLINIKTGVEDVDNKNQQIQLYPNPNDGRFSISLSPAPSLGQRYITLEVVNAVGQIIYKIPNSPKPIPMNISLPAGVMSGVYQLRVRTENGVQVVRFTVNK